MFQSCPSGEGTVDKINSVSSSIPSDSSINRATASPECVPLSLTYIRWSTPNWSALLGIRCWFKMNTDSVSLCRHESALCMCPSPLNLIHHRLSVSCMPPLSQGFFCFCLTVCVTSLHLSPLTSSHQSVSKQLKSSASSSQRTLPLSEMLKFSTCHSWRHLALTRPF